MDLILQIFLIVTLTFFVFVIGVKMGKTVYTTELNSKEILTPYKKLVIVNNKVDTIYQYKLKK